jgi:hypothetical protein
MEQIFGSIHIPFSGVVLALQQGRHGRRDQAASKSRFDAVHSSSAIHQERIGTSKCLVRYCRASIFDVLTMCRRLRLERFVAALQRCCGTSRRA